MAGCALYKIFSRPSGWMAKENQHDLKKDKVSNPDETSVDKVTTRNDRSAEVLSFCFVSFSFVTTAG